MPQVTRPNRKATLVSPSGFVSRELDGDESFPDTEYVGKTGLVEESYDTGYDSEYPTGYEPVMACVNFGTPETPDRLWIPLSSYVGERNGKDVFQKHLKFIE